MPEMRHLQCNNAGEKKTTIYHKSVVVSNHTAAPLTATFWGDISRCIHSLALQNCRNSFLFQGQNRGGDDGETNPVGRCTSCKSSYAAPSEAISAQGDFVSRHMRRSAAAGRQWMPVKDFERRARAGQAARGQGPGRACNASLSWPHFEGGQT